MKTPTQLEGDVMYGEELSVADEYLYSVNPKWYYDSKVNIVTETLYENSQIHITEKTFRAIALEMPFVLVAPAGSLEYMREYGFKTFGDVFDESYRFQLVDM